VADLDFLSVFLIAIGLSADCFAVALGISFSCGGLPFHQVFRVPLAFGLFQAAMTTLGWLAGRTIEELISSYDHWVAFGLLAFVGIRMIWESFHSGESRRKNIDITKGMVLLMLSFATSIDALAVGLTFGLVKIGITLASLTIGLVAFVITGVGFLLGRKLSSIMGRRAEIVGGAVLIAIGLRILLEHIL